MCQSCSFMGMWLPCWVLELRYFYIFFTGFILLFCLVLYWFVSLILLVQCLQVPVEAFAANCFNHLFEKCSFVFVVFLNTFKCLCLFDFEDRFLMDLSSNLFHLLLNSFFNHFLLIGKILLKSILHEIEDDLNFQQRLNCFL